MASAPDPPETQANVELALRVRHAFVRRFGAEPRWLALAPGRVNLLGAHIDYSEGWVLPAAVDRAVCVAAAPASGGATTVVAMDLGEEAAFEHDSIGPPREGLQERPPWLGYPAGVAWAMRESGLSAPPINALLSGDIPIGAGMSSSAALEVAFVLIWEAASGASLSGLARAEIGRTVENDFLGVGSGIMDQYASVHGRAGHLLLLDCRTLTHESIQLPTTTTILIADSGIRRRLADVDYNKRPDECAEAVSILQTVLPEIRALRDVGPRDLNTYEHLLPSTLAKRARHAVDECQRVLAGATALREGNLTAFGQLMRASHESSRDLYEVSIPELDTLAESAWEVDGCYGARLTGAGFGGCVTALIEESATALLVKTLESAFRERFSRRLETFDCRIADGARLVSASDLKDGCGRKTVD